MIAPQGIHTIMRFFLVQASVLLLFLVGVNTSAYAEAFRILDQSAAATGQGTAFAAQADEPSAVYFNPAAMTKLPGIQVSTGILFVNGDINFTPTTGPMVEGDFGSAIANPPPASLYITAGLKYTPSCVSFGFRPASF